MEGLSNLVEVLIRNQTKRYLVSGLAGFVLATNISHPSACFDGFQDRDDGSFAEFALSHLGLLA
jgi:hypothetical protein